MEDLDFIRNLIRIGTVKAFDKLLINDIGILVAKVSFSSGLENNSTEDVIIVQNFGEETYPPITGSQCLSFNINGVSENKIGFILNKNGNIAIKEKEKLIHNILTKIHLKNDGSLDIETSKDCNIKSKGKVNIEAKNIEIKSNANLNITAANTKFNGNVQITENLIVDGNSTLTGTATSIGGRVFLAHTHIGNGTGVNTGGVN